MPQKPRGPPGISLARTNSRGLASSVSRLNGHWTEASKGADCWGNLREHVSVRHGDTNREGRSRRRAAATADRVAPFAGFFLLPFLISFNGPNSAGHHPLLRVRPPSVRHSRICPPTRTTRVAASRQGGVRSIRPAAGCRLWAQGQKNQVARQPLMQGAAPTSRANGRTKRKGYLAVGCC